MKNRKSLLRLALLAIAVLFSSVSNAQLLKGTICDSLRDFVVMRYFTIYDGGLKMNYSTLEVDKNGHYVFDKPMTDERTECLIIFTPENSCGAFFQKGKTTVMDVTADAANKAVVKYAGDNVEESKFCTLYYRYFAKKTDYISRDPKKVISYDEAMKLLDSHCKELKKALKSIKNKDNRYYLSRLLDLTNIDFSLSIRNEELKRLGKTDNEYDAVKAAIIKKIDPNEDQGIKFHLPHTYIMSFMPHAVSYYMGKDMTDFGLQCIDIANKYVTNPHVREYFADQLASLYFNNGKNNTVEKFWPAFKQFAGADSKTVQRYQKKVDAMTGLMTGAKAADATFFDIDGKQHKLSDYFGKMLYIDVWASWCKPCCKEIPHLAKLVEHYKGNDKIQFISISVDKDQSEWIKKVKADNSPWAQFIMKEDEYKSFSKFWGIDAIPHFIVVDKDGKIVNTDTLRPSDRDIIPTLDKWMK
jgi:thiol-disulfide isomerase/thioredoxin